MINPSFWHGRRVLVTGHTGFKGSWLQLWLNQMGSEVWGYSLPPESDNSLFHHLKFATTYHREANISNLSLLNAFVEECQPEIVFHLAAQPLVRLSYEDPIGTWGTNVMGSLKVLESLKHLRHKCSVVMITTDKVYENKEWQFGYRENDRLGGHDPYSSSKAAAEIAIASWKNSFCGNQDHQTSYLNIATARAGNVIGGGDWAVDRIVPDAVRSLSSNEVIKVRNPYATRPWQHVLEPLGGYLLLAESLSLEKEGCVGAFNFGPSLESNRKVGDLVSAIVSHWPGEWQDCSNPDSFHEASLLHLQIDKAFNTLKWQPKWDFEKTVQKTIQWYKSVSEGKDPRDACLLDLKCYQDTFS